jgi:hypothetical protein
VWESIKYENHEIPKTSGLLLIAHSQEHCDNLVADMRLKGIVPPSSEPLPTKK